MHSVQTVGDFTITAIHPLVLGGVPLSLKGFKLEGDIFDTAQTLDNSKLVPLLDGSTITITNTNRSGVITIHCCKQTGDLLQGDITEFANFLQSVGDAQGGTLRVSYSFNGKLYATTFMAVTVKTAPPLKIAGNDVPDYSIEFNYGEWSRT